MYFQRKFIKCLNLKVKSLILKFKDLSFICHYISHSVNVSTSDKALQNSFSGAIYEGNVNLSF